MNQKIEFTQHQQQLLVKAATQYKLNFNKIRYLFPGYTAIDLQEKFENLHIKVQDQVLDNSSKFQRRNNRQIKVINKSADSMVCFDEKRLSEAKAQILLLLGKGQ